MLSKMHKKWLLWLSIPLIPAFAFALAPNPPYSCTAGACPSLGTQQAYASAAANEPTVSVVNPGSVTDGHAIELTTSGNGSAGISVSNSGKVLNSANFVISTIGELSPGILADTSGVVTINFAQITTTGSNSPGIIAQNGGVVSLASSSVRSNIITTGSGGFGLFLLDGGEIHLTNYNVTAFANDNNGVFIRNTLASFATNVLTLTNTNLSAFTDTILVTGSQTAANISVVNSVIDSVNGAILRATNNIVGVSLTATNSRLNGDVIGDFDNIANLILIGSTVWTGSTGPSGDGLFNMDMQSSNTIWFMTGDSTFFGNISNSGLIYFEPPGKNTFKTLTVAGTYNGNNGNLQMNAYLGSDNSPADKLVLTGGGTLHQKESARHLQDAATGNTFIYFLNIAGPGAQTVGDGIPVVLTTGPTITTSPTAFQLGAPVVAGPYEYFLLRGGLNGNNPQNWYLRTNPPLIPLRFVNLPYYRSETSLFSTLPSLAILYTRGIISTLHQRVGQQNFSEYPNSYCGTLEFGHGGWFRLINGGGDINNGNIYEHGANFKYHYLGLQTGYDFYHRLYEWGGRDYSGLILTMGDATSHAEHFTGVGAGEDSLWGTSLGAYYTYYGQAGWYIDGVLMGNLFDMQADPTRLPEVTPSGNSIAASLEAGYPFHLNEKTALEPQAQVIYQTLAVDDAHDPGTTVRFNRTQSFLSRIGLLLGKTWCPNTGFLHAVTSNISGWARLNYWHEASGTSTTNFSSADGWVPFKSELAGNFLQADFGVSTHITKQLSFFADAGGGYYLQNKGRLYSIDAGFRMSI